MNDFTFIDQIYKYLALNQKYRQTHKFNQLIRFKQCPTLPNRVIHNTSTANQTPSLSAHPQNTHILPSRSVITVTFRVKYLLFKKKKKKTLKKIFEFKELTNCDECAPVAYALM